MPTKTIDGKKLSTVELNWKEVFCTNCGMAAPELLEQAGKDLIEERWEKATTAKLPQATVVRLGWWMTISCRT